MAIPKSRFKKRFVYIQFLEDGPWMKGFVRKVTMECGYEAYEVAWDDKRVELVFVSSVHRIVEENPVKARIIDFKKRRMKLIKLV